MTRKNVQAYKALKKYYMNGEPPIEVVMDQLKLTPDEALALVEYVKAPRPKKVAPTPALVELATKPEPFTVHMPIKKITRDKIIAIIRWPMLILGLGAFFLSCYFSIDALSRRQPIAIAWIMGLVLIGFGLVSSQLSVYYKRKKSKNWVIFGVAWLLILVYSINTTTSSFYDHWVMNSAKTAQAASSGNTNRELLASYERQLTDKATLMQDKRKRLTVFQATLKLYEDPAKVKGSEYNNATWGALSLEKEIGAVAKEIDALNKSKDTLLLANPAIMVSAVQSSSYYEWVATVFKRLKLSADTLQFIVDLIPAIVLDMISSLAIYVFLFLGRKEVDLVEEV